MWVRGLKLIFALHRKKCMTSHPMWVRGLKHVAFWTGADRPKSHPMWVRGLKLLSARCLTKKICRTLCGCVD